jgi:hypothetical protein
MWIASVGTQAGTICVIFASNMDRNPGGLRSRLATVIVTTLPTCRKASWQTPTFGFSVVNVVQCSKQSKNRIHAAHIAL